MMINGFVNCLRKILSLVPLLSSWIMFFPNCSSLSLTISSSSPFSDVSRISITLLEGIAQNFSLENASLLIAIILKIKLCQFVEFRSSLFYHWHADFYAFCTHRLSKMNNKRIIYFAGPVGNNYFYVFLSRSQHRFTRFCYCAYLIRFYYYSVYSFARVFFYQLRVCCSQVVSYKNFFSSKTFKNFFKSDFIFFREWVFDIF